MRDLRAYLVLSDRDIIISHKEHKLPQCAAFIVTKQTRSRAWFGH